MDNEEIKFHIQDLILKGHVKPRSSPCRSPIVRVRKKDGTWKIYIDYRSLNKITVKNQFPIPRIDGLLD
jgi:putative transposase